MFTGIVEELGVISAIRRSHEGGKITIKAEKAIEGTNVSDSISVNGVCLTVVDVSTDRITMDILKETLDRSTLAKASVSDKVNLERSLLPSSRLGGHFVFGHVDCRGRIVEVNRAGRDWLFKFSVDQDLMPFIAPKGSIAVDGISLTVVETVGSTFTVYMIPHTYEKTTMQFRKPGDDVNIEVDMLARYVHQAISSMQNKDSKITEDYLRKTGFI